MIIGLKPLEILMKFKNNINYIPAQILINVLVTYETTYLIWYKNLQLKLTKKSNFNPRESQLDLWPWDILILDTDVSWTLAKSHTFKIWTKNNFD